MEGLAGFDLHRLGPKLGVICLLGASGFYYRYSKTGIPGVSTQRREESELGIVKVAEDLTPRV